jgi:hypothetical protein
MSVISLTIAGSNKLSHDLCSMRDAAASAVDFHLALILFVKRSIKVPFTLQTALYDDAAWRRCNQTY